MGTHLIPREVGGEARILIIFTPKGFIGILIGLIPGMILYEMFLLFGSSIMAWVSLVLCALIGFAIGQMKIPESKAFDLFKKTGGSYIREVIMNYFKFKKNRKYYVYDSEVIKK